MEPKKLTKQEFADKYGYDPRTRTSIKAPTQGAIGGDTTTMGGSTPSAKELLTQIRGGNNINTATESGQVSSGSTTGDMLSKLRSSDTPTQSGYKPGKFIQSMEDIRPDYSGGTLSDIGEGLGDIGVGVAKGITRMPINIIQALTPDKMFGENSLLNSDSERARAFESATKGKTGLQKLGATGVDVASLFTPVGAEKGATTLAGLAGRGLGKSAALATGNNTGMLARGLNYVAPIVGESVAGTAMLGGDAGDIGGDVAISVALPTVLKPVYKYLKSAFSGPMAKTMLADYIGSGSMAKRGIEDAVNVISKDTEKKLGVIQQGRKLVENMVSPLFVKSNFGTTEADVSKFNEAADLVMTYYAPKPGPNRVMDWTEGATKLAKDLDEAGSLKSTALNMLGDISTDPNNVFAQTVRQLEGSTKKSNGFIKAQNNIKNTINGALSNPYNTLGKKGKLDLESLNKFKNDMWEFRSQANNADEKEVYKQFAAAIDTRIGNEAKRAGKSELFNDYLRENAEYSLLKDTQKIMESLANKKNPMYTTQMFDHAFGLASAGMLSGGDVKSGITYAAMRMLSKMAGKAFGDMKLNSMSSNPYRRAIAEVDTAAKEKARTGLRGLIDKQSKK